MLSGYVVSTYRVPSEPSEQSIRPSSAAPAAPIAAKLLGSAMVMRMQRGTQGRWQAAAAAAGGLHRKLVLRLGPLLEDQHVPPGHLPRRPSAAH